MKLLNMLILVFGLSLPGLIMAQSEKGFVQLDEAVTVKNLIRESSASTSSISSDFVQMKHLMMMEEVLESKGRFLFRKENDVRWEYSSPIDYAIIIHNDSFVINNDGKISEYNTESNKLFKEINNMIVMAIQGDFVDDEKFAAVFYENETSYLARLTPTDALLGDIMQNIEITFEKKGMGVSKVKFIEPGDDYTAITFSNRQINQEISDDQFTVQ